MTRLDWGATHPKTRHRFCLAGSPMAIDSAPVYVEASGGEPVKLDLSSTALLQVLAAELHEAGLLDDFIRAATSPRDTEVQQVVLPRLRLHERIVSALTLTWTADMARDVAAQLVEAADVAESDDRNTFQFAAGAVDLTQADQTIDETAEATQ